MTALQRSDLMSLEQYAESRSAFRARVIEHKKARQIALGEHARLYFEDALTIQYQVQEMLRIERIFEAAAIQEELDAYNPLIPDGSNWKATFMIEYPEVAERREALARMRGVEHGVWTEIAGERIFAIANEDLERTNDEKTAAVHFLRFELTPAMCSAVKAGADIRMGIEHSELKIAVTLEPSSRDTLAADLA